MRMSGWKAIVGLAIAIPLVACFGSALFGGRVLAYRDAAHFYYPLEHWLAERWGQGEVPLWNSQDGNGVPVVAEATSAVFYPGKLIYALPLSFPQRFTLYVIAHLLWAAWGAYLLVRDGLRALSKEGTTRRSLEDGNSATAIGERGSVGIGPGLSAVAYAFGGSVLFQYSNIVFLVGAAWLPWTLWALRHMLDERRGLWLLVSAACLALTVLGGDAQTAYHAGLGGILYGLLNRNGRGSPAASPSTVRQVWTDWGAALGWLAAAAGLGVLLAAVQVFPTWHWTANSDRVLYSHPRSVYEVRPFLARSEPRSTDAAEKNTEAQTGWAGVARGLFGAPEPREHHGQIYQFSVAPWRFIECMWPNITGKTFPENRRWLTAVDAEDRIWIPSLYFGILPLLVAVGTWSLRSRAAHIRWFSWLLLLALVASFGSYGVGYFVKAVSGWWLNDADALPIGDGVGGLYWWMVVLLPGHAQFRYPAKLLAFATLAAAALAGLGWHTQLLAARSQLAKRLGRMTAMSCAVAGGILLSGPWWSAWLAGAQPNELYGPLAVRAAWTDAWGACLHTSILCGAVWLLLRRGTELPRWVSPLLVVLTAGEIAWANSWMIQTAPAAVMQTAALPLRDGSSTVPPTVYRWQARTWVPSSWPRSSSPRRAEQTLQWDVATLYAKLHLLGPLRSLHPHNTVAPSQYRAVLAAGGRGIPHPDALNLLGAECLLLPASVRGQPAWSRRELPNIHDGDNVAMWHNGGAFPPAWIVHACETTSAPFTTEPSEVRSRARELLWPSDTERDLQRTAVVEVPAGERVPEMQTPVEPNAEHVSVTRLTCSHFVLQAHLEAAGLVVWNQYFDSQWSVTVSPAEKAVPGQPPRRVNLIMQGVFLPAGDYKLDFQYQPHDVWWGGFVSGLSWLGVVCVGLYGMRRPCIRR